MKINTKFHEEIDVQKEEILHFKKGIPGFPDEKEFVILPLSNDGTFSVMQSVSTERLAFIIADPFAFFQEYDFQLEEHAVKTLLLLSEKDVKIFVILTINEPFEKTTANLQAPIVINTATKEAQQVILNDPAYTTKHSIFSKPQPVTVKE
ncbi:flagellar assembly protein FliW [Bacillus sp. 03113]|uniref:flagellar assembly protein FliW n=1 Tax=Bacillus sp. 03113 TaxID=2578211 RepID=UPI001142A4B9|nr:flagellar assembly protein FliW [Bacillus sp. 03113]